jgi:adenosine kinase
VDVIARADDAFLSKQNMAKGGMSLIDEPRATQIYKDMGPGTESSGGSAANTIVGLASFGAKVAFVGKVKDDVLGKVFQHDIRAAGVAFETPAAKDGASTACCYVLVTPDGQRTMNTYLGAAQNLHPRDIDAKQIADAAIVYLEGYLWDPKDAKDAFVAASKAAHAAGRRVALTLSDAFCVGRYRDEFLGLMRNGTVDIIFANEAELSSLYQTEDFDKALSQLRKDVKLAAVTRSEKGCVIVQGDKTVAVPAAPIKQLVDTTGAGDLFAAGFLFGIARGADLETAGKLGGLAASEVIQHIGARPAVSLKDFAASAGLKV